MKRTTDPYKILGVLRGADLVQIKSAHRRLAKRFHPDGSTGDEVRFRDVQEAYQLLSDPQLRAEWDLHHAPGPMRAGTNGARRNAARPAGRTTRRAPRPTVRRGTPRPMRPPGQRKRTWSAEHVPWWDEFDPGKTAAAAGPDTGPDAAPKTDGADGPGAPTMDFDVFDRSSGAAWSSAARRHFRRGTDDLPSRGAWRYRGTQVVTGAEARKVAAEEEDKRKRR
jgi:curved DNA-binding protein CbpA